jgi:hypothetical protein
LSDFHKRRLQGLQSCIASEFLQHWGEDMGWTVFGHRKIKVDDVAS